MCGCDKDARWVCGTCRQRPWWLAGWKEEVLAAEKHPAPEPTPRTFAGVLPTGVPVSITLHDSEGVADLTFKHDGRWVAPVELTEETA